jgi:hypothetical protein
MSAPPIILIHRGHNPYLAHTIAQARSSNPKSRLILLGDRSNSFYLGVEHHYYEDYFVDAARFADIFTYDYFPTYQYGWILFCHQKYFALRDFIKAQGITSFLLIDSDVLIYESIIPYFEYFSGYRMTLSAGSSRPSAQAAFAIVNDPSIIADLCELYIDLFDSSPQELGDRFGLSCFTEMLGLGLLMRDPQKSVKNTYEENTGFVVNHNLLADQRFEKDGEFCRIFWKDNVPMHREKDSGRILKTPAIHFHGHAKRQMHRNLKLTSGRLKWEHAVNWTLSKMAKYPMRLANEVTGRAIFPGLKATKPPFKN